MSARHNAEAAGLGTLKSLASRLAVSDAPKAIWFIHCAGPQINSRIIRGDRDIFVTALNHTRDGRQHRLTLSCRRDKPEGTPEGKPRALSCLAASAINSLCSPRWCVRVCANWRQTRCEVAAGEIQTVVATHLVRTSFISFKSQLIGIYDSDMYYIHYPSGWLWDRGMITRVYPGISYLAQRGLNSSLYNSHFISNFQWLSGRV